MVGIDFACCAPANEEKSEENPYNADVQVGRRLGLPGVPGRPGSAGPSGPCDARRFLSLIFGPNLHITDHSWLENYWKHALLSQARMLNRGETPRGQTRCVKTRKK